MVDIIAEPVAPQVYIWMNGFFDQLVLGLPLYFWIFILFVVVLGILFIIIYYVWWMVMPPVKGYFSAYRHGVPLAFNINRTRGARLVPVKYLAKIFTSMQLPLAWLLTSNTAGIDFGGVRTIITRDDWGIVSDPRIEAAILELKNKWNEKYKSHEEKQIKNWKQFQEHLLAGDFITICEHNKITLPPLDVVDIFEVKQFLAHQSMDAATHSGWIEARARELAKESETVKNAGLYLMGGGGVMVVCAIIAYFILNIGH